MRMWQQDNEQQVLQQNWQGSAGWYDWDLKKKKKMWNLQVLLLSEKAVWNLNRILSLFFDSTF